MSLKNLLKTAEEGRHSACQKCPWNPKFDEEAAFGVSCVKHGIDWSLPVSAVSILIAQDPANTTPAKTGRLCGFCNTQFASDKSANHGYDLWNAAVSLAEYGLAVNRYMKNHYWTNAIMHGGSNEKQRESARVCCTRILFEQISLLSPRIIIVTGKVASESLFDLKFLSKRWDEFKSVFSHQVYSELTTLPSGKKATVYCTYHGSSTVVNTHVADLYSDDTKNTLNKRIGQLPDASSAQNFLRKYPDSNEQGRGMRVLLLHWLEIGESIRRANAE